MNRQTELNWQCAVLYIRTRTTAHEISDSRMLDFRWHYWIGLLGVSKSVKIPNNTAWRKKNICVYPIQQFLNGALLFFLLLSFGFTINYFFLKNTLILIVTNMKRGGLLITGGLLNWSPKLRIGSPCIPLQCRNISLDIKWLINKVMKFKSVQCMLAGIKNMCRWI